MNYVVLETFGAAGYAIIVTDENGNNKVFDTQEKAKKEAGDCQEVTW